MKLAKTQNLTKWMLAAAVAGASAAAPALRADDPSEEIKALKQQIEALTRKVQALEDKTAAQSPPPANAAAGEAAADARVDQLEQQVKVIERKRELEQEAAAEKAKSTPLVSLGASGFQVRSADSNFVFGIRGYVQANGRWGIDDGAAPYEDTFLMRRVRPIFEGSLYKIVDYRVMLDFASGISSSVANDGFLQDAYANFKLWPEFQVQAGKMKEPVGLERLQSGANLLFVERGFPTLLVPNRNVGGLVQGDVLGAKLNYQAGFFNGTPDGGSTDFQAIQGYNFAGRLFAQPFKGGDVEALEGLGIGLAGTYGEYDGSLRSYVSPAQRTVWAYYSGTGALPNVLGNGEQWRVTPQGYWYWGPFGLFGEYVISSQDVIQAGGGATKGATASLANSAWQLAASYFLTGEKNSWKPVTVRRPVTFAEGGGLGAVEVAARIQGLDFADDAFPVFANPAQTPTGAFAWGAGVNWYLNRNLKLSLDYENTQFKGGEKNPVTQQHEQIIMGQFQISF